MLARPGLRELDLDNCLLHDWAQVAALAALPRLEELRLSRNRLAALPLDAPLALRPFGSGFPQLLRLFLNDVPHAWAHVLELARAGLLPRLEELHLCRNALERFEGARSPADVAACFPALQLLNVSENALSDWAQVETFSAAPRCAARSACTHARARARRCSGRGAQAGARAAERQRADGPRARRGRLAAAAMALAQRQQIQLL